MKKRKINKEYRLLVSQIIKEEKGEVDSANASGTQARTLRRKKKSFFFWIFFCSISSSSVLSW